MIILLLQGGLGNQLFQLAYACQLSRDFSRKIYINKTVLRRSKESSRDTNSLPDELLKLLNITEIKSDRLIGKLFNLTKWSRVMQFIDEPEAESFLPDIRRSSCSFYVKGYFQAISPDSYGYKLVMEKLNILKNCDSYNIKKQWLLEHNLDDMKWCIHIRQGDFFKAGIIQKILEPEYYNAALRILGYSGSETIHVFSDDDPNSYIENITGINSKIVDTSNMSPIEVLFLMSEFQFIITANSTFSVWAAHLAGEKPDFIVRPANWNYGDNIEWGELLSAEDWLKA